MNAYNRGRKGWDLLKYASRHHLVKQAKHNPTPYSESSAIKARAHMPSVEPCLALQANPGLLWSLAG